MGLNDIAAELAAITQSLIDETGETYALVDLHRLQAEINNANGQTGAAETQLKKALDVARKQGAKLWELRAAIDLARLLQEQKRIDEAVALLDPIHNSIAEGDCPEDRATAKAMLRELTT